MTDITNLTVLTASRPGQNAAAPPSHAIPPLTFLGNPATQFAAPSTITMAGATAMLDLFTPELQGLVPPPGASTPPTYVLQANGQWVPQEAAVGGVTSVFGRTGTIVAESGDYSFAQISGSVAPAQLPVFTTTAIGAVPAPGSSVPATYVLTAAGTWVAPPAGGSGTVTSVAATVPTGLSVAGSPITTAGTLALSWSGTIPNAQVPNPTTTAPGGVISGTAPAGQFVTGVSTSGTLTYGPAPAGTVTSVAATVPTGLTISGSPITSAGTLAVSWSGTIPNAQVPTPTASALGGVQSGTAPAGQFVTGVSTSGALTFGTPAQGGGGTVTSVAATVPTGLSVAGSPITTSGTLALSWSGTIPNAQVPTPTASARGGVQSATAPANQFATGINTSGVLTFAQPSFANISGTLSSAQLPAGTGTVTSVAATVPTGLAISGSPITSSGTLAVSWSGTIPNAQVPTPTTSALGGVTSATAPAGQFVTGVNASGALTFATPAAAAPQLTLSIVKFNSSGTYTRPAGLQYAIVECIGGGGAGGTVSPGQTGGAGGGGSGGYSRTVLSAAQIGASQTVSIGAGSITGAANAGATSFGTLCIANGGTDGDGINLGQGALGQGGPGGAVGTGTVALPGAAGQMGTMINNVLVQIGGIGGVIVGGSVRQTQAGNQNQGIAGTSALPNTGAGGCGAAGINVPAGGDTPGGNGGSGYCVVTEFRF
jgi:hypothetical protein